MSGLLRLFGSRVVSGGRPKINAMRNLTRMLPTTLPGDHNRYGDQSRDGTKKSGLLGAAGVIGAGFAVGGMTYAYKIFADEKASCSGKKCDIPKAPEPFSECFARKKREESPRNPDGVIVKANQDLEKSLNEAQKLAMEANDVALKVLKDAQELFLKCLGLICFEVIGNDEPLETLCTKEAVSAWCDLLIEICQMIKDVIEKESSAWDLLNRLREVIENGKASQYTTSNPLLITAENALMDAEKKLRKASKQIRAATDAFAEGFVSGINSERNKCL